MLDGNQHEHTWRRSVTTGNTKVNHFWPPETTARFQLESGNQLTKEGGKGMSSNICILPHSSLDENLETMKLGLYFIQVSCPGSDLGGGMAGIPSEMICSSLICREWHSYQSSPPTLRHLSNQCSVVSEADWNGSSLP